MITIVFLILFLLYWLNYKDKERNEKKKERDNFERERINSVYFPPKTVIIDPSIEYSTTPVTFDMVHNEQCGLKEGDYVTPIEKFTGIRGKVTVIPGKYYRVVKNRNYDPHSCDVWNSCAFNVEHVRGDSLNFSFGQRPGYGYNWRKIIL